MPLSTEVSWYFDDEGDLSSLTSDSEDEDELELEEEPEIRPPPVRAPRPTPAAPALKAPKSTRPSTQSATEKSRARNGLKASTPCLRPPRTVTYSVSTLHDWVDQGLVDLDAEYQRGIVWNELKQMSLIDSLVHNFYIPPIVFAVERRPDGSECRICIDGKQRLTSIHRFSKGDVSRPYLPKHSTLKLTCTVLYPF
ncbi:hypothetical protein M413DRAFT_377417 [Hebeloma cylindrosporum]|uniref:GmrSD restriction endonucleases N-terminal domain-containing protein n=1 Tax=Hebeloma cylindrosporum TaxID=76867 RepID=A0A0C2Y326_HEBCY|nr:hypothetical protein M413DRAFT_377417 [Hebeloma cylindrosporum h7]